MPEVTPRRFVAAALCGLILTATLCAQPSIVVGGPNAPPYRIFDSHPASGFYVDVMNEVALELHATVVYVDLPMARALEEMNSGQIDMMLGPNLTPEREQTMDFLTEVPLPREEKVFYRVVGSADVTSLPELEGRSVGVLRGALHDPRFDADSRVTKVPLNSYQSGLEMVASKRLDLVVIPEREGDWLVRSLGLTLAKSSLRFAGEESYFAISRQSPVRALRSQMVQALEKLQRSGRLKELADRW